MKKIFAHGAWLGLLYAIVYLVLGLWGHPLWLPFQDQWDGLFYPMLAKMQIWPWWKEPSLGWPVGLNLLDHPDVDFFQLFPIKILYRLTRNPFLACNIWFLASFGLCYASAYYSLRYFKIERFTAAAASVLFSLLPYHFHRGMMHLFLGGYMAIPLILPLVDWARESIWAREKSFRWAAFLSILLSTSIYYTLISAIAVVMMASIENLKSFSLSKIKRSFMILAFLSVGLTVTLAPWFVQKVSLGNNLEVSVRTFQESDALGLRLSQLIMPSAGHRIDILANLGESLREGSKAAMETEWSNLGFLGALGFLFLLYLLFQPKAARDKRLGLLSRLNVILFLFSTIGGFGFLFSYFVHPVLRAQNRVSVFLGFLSISALAIMWDRLKFQKNKPFLFGLALVGLVLIGAWEQTSVNFRLNSEEIMARFEIHENLIHKIERLHPGAVDSKIKIFQIPFVPFPETPPVGLMKDYEHFRPFLQSERLQVSYGVMKGRGEDVEFKRIASLAAKEMADACTQLGYDGIWINRFGVSEEGRKLISDFKKMKRFEVLESIGVDASLAYVDLTGAPRAGTNW